LIHEVAIARPELMSEAYIQRNMGHHTTACEAGTKFAHTKPKLAAFTRLVFLPATGSRRQPWTISLRKRGRLTTVLWWLGMT